MPKTIRDKLKAAEDRLEDLESAMTILVLLSEGGTRVLGEIQFPENYVQDMPDKFRPPE